MWATKGGDEDWLAEETIPASKVVYTPAQVPHMIQAIDLTVSVPSEPLHALPEAPPCSIRMYYYVLRISYRRYRRRSLLLRDKDPVEETSRIHTELGYLWSLEVL